jgi:hypothetical protein
MLNTLFTFFSSHSLWLVSEEAFGPNTLFYLAYFYFLLFLFNIVSTILGCWLGLPPLVYLASVSVTYKKKKITSEPIKLFFFFFLYKIQRYNNKTEVS